jgi:uncharacterized membrane protein YdfJ with MMPL/SSD domain
VSLVVAGIPLVSALGYTAAIAVATAVLAAVTLLPALMSLAGRHINSLSLPRRLHPSDAPGKKGLWGTWSGFVLRRPYVPLVLAALVLVPLIIPVFSLRLGQEDIGQTAKSTMERRAFDLMAAGFGPGYNGPLLLAASIHPVAQADPSVIAKENKLKALQKELEAEQKQGNQMKAQLEAGQARLESQQAALEHQQAVLNDQAGQLRSEQASLEAQAAQLQAQRDQLEAQARALAEQARSLARRLIFLGARERRIERLLETVTNPARIERLMRRLARVQATERQVRAELETVRKRARRLAAEARSLQAEATALEQQKQSLEAQQAALEAQAAQLQKQANALEAEAAQLQQEKAQLLALQAKAAKQKKQANKLHNELVKTLTKAGGDDRGTDQRLVKLQDALTDTKGDLLVSPPELNKTGSAAVYTVIASTAPADPATAGLVKKLRSSVIPPNTGNGVVAFVGGSTASNVDLAAEISKRLPLVIVTILLLSMLVLLVAFHSLLIPLQAALTNLLTALAAFGIVTVVFQWGWGIDAVGIDTTADSVPIASYVPLMMFAVLFGLSMDYQVFLLSSVHHHRSAGADDRTAVGLGLRTSARVISAAALIMIAVFSSFILNGDPVVKQFGVGLSSAVALAATMVLVLAPALLVFMGSRAWWIPDAVGRFIPRIDVEGADLDEEPAPSTPATGGAAR